MAEIIRIHHVAILVDDMQATLNFWQDALGMEVTGMKDMPSEQAQIAFLPLADSEIELVKPTSEESGLGRFLEKRGPGMHHICLQVDDISGMLARLKDRGIEMINQEPRLGSDGRKYAFVHPKSAHGVMVELYELPE